MAAKGGVRVNITGDSSQLKRELNEADRAVGKFADDTEKHTSRMSRAFSAVAPSMAVGAAAVGAFGLYSIKMASDTGEALNVVKLSFGDLSDELDYFARNAAESMGMSRKEFLLAAGSIGSLLQPMGVADAEAAKMSASLIQRAADIGSAFNASGEEVTEAMRSAFAGETEPMRRFGVFLSEARIQAEALALGLGDVSGTTNLAGKAQATWSLIMKDSNMVAGDFVNTLGESMPNKTKVARAEFDNLAEQLGEKLLPIAIEVLDKILDGLEAFGEWWDTDGKQLMEDFKAGWEDLGAGVDELQVQWDEFVESYEGWTGESGGITRFSQFMDEAGWGVDEFQRGIDGLKIGWGEVVTYFPIGAQMIGGALWEIGANIWQVLQWIGGVIDWVFEKLGAVGDKVGEVLGPVADFVYGNGFGPIGGAVEGAVNAARDLFGFDAGGVVPGPRGASRLAVVHGGETILPTHKNSDAGVGAGMTVTVPVYLDGKQIANVVTPYLQGDRRSRTGSRKVA